MQCPRCHTTTSPLENNGVTVDVCKDGCGGVWFEWQELRKLDENHEADPQFLTKLSQTKTKQLPLAERVECPQCDDMIMMRRFWSVKRQIEVDECPKCGGIWLDAGELTHIHAQFKTEEERRKATDQFINDMFETNYSAEISNQKEALEKTRRAVRFLSPYGRFSR